MSQRGDWRHRTVPLWLARVALSAVFLVNLECALAFLLNPVRYVPNFEMSGLGGRVAVQGFGIFILLWIVPYPAAIYHPRRQMLSFAYAVVSQAIGTVGETILFLALPPGHLLLRATGLRFMLVDGTGLLALAGAFLLVWLTAPPGSIPHQRRELEITSMGRGS